MITVYFGTLVVATAVTILAPSLAMPPASYLRPTMKPVMFCKNSSGMLRWLAGVRAGQVVAARPLRASVLAGRRLHERGPAEEDRALIAHDDALIRHRRHVGAAGGAGAHHDRDLGNAERRHARLIVEDAAEVALVRKDFVLQRQERAAGVHHVDARQVVLARDVLRAQMLLHRHRVVGAALDGGIVGDDDAFAAADAADAGDQARGMNVAAVHAVRGQR